MRWASPTWPSMRTRRLLLVVSLVASPALAQQLPSDAAAQSNRLIASATRDSAAWKRLALMTDTFGPRFSGSTNLEHAIDWIVAEMKKDGLENVHTEPVMVTHWVRGTESAEVVSPRAFRLNMLGLGRSVGTPVAGITAPVLVVHDFAELRRRSAEARGRIIVFNF